MFNQRLLSFEELLQVNNRTGFAIKLDSDGQRYEYRGIYRDGLVKLHNIVTGGTKYVKADQAFSFSPNGKMGPALDVLKLSKIWGEEFTCALGSDASDGILNIRPDMEPNEDGYCYTQRKTVEGALLNDSWSFYKGDHFYLYDADFETEREKEVRKQISAFISEGFDKNLEQLTFGFELETQETNGATADNWRHLLHHSRPEFDYDKYKADYSEAYALYEAVKRSYFRWPNTTSALYSLFSPLGRVRMRAFMDAMEIETTDDLIAKGLTTQEEVDLILEAIHAEAHDPRRYEDDEDEGYYDYYKAFPELPDTLEVVDDGSVRGFEFRTKGGLKLDQFNSAVEHIFGNGYTHTIDSRCSFHIHLRLGDIKHTFSRAKQQQMIKYLVSNMDRLPESVQLRWGDRDAVGFFDPAKKHTKYAFINFHQQGTMEFRCFGNIDNADDAKTCLKLAVEALRYAYTNQQKEITNSAWTTAVKTCMRNRTGKTLDRVEDLILTIEAIAEERAKRIKQLEKESQLKIDKVQQELTQQIAG